MVGKSTCGRGATGRNGKAARPTNANAAIRSEVAIGRWMNGSEIFTSGPALLQPRQPNRLPCTAHQRDSVAPRTYYGGEGVRATSRLSSLTVRFSRKA